MTDTSILTAEEIASVRREFRAASLLPKRVYHDPTIHEWERANILRRDWEKGLGKKLQGKLHIYVGDMDNYYQNNAVYLETGVVTPGAGAAVVHSANASFDPDPAVLHTGGRIRCRNLAIRRCVAAA